MSWRYASGAWTELTETPDRTIDISGLDPGLVEVSVRTVNALGNQSVPLEASITVQGKLAPPANVSGFSLAFTATGIQATWAECPDVDWTATEISRSIDFIPSQQVTLKRSTTHLMGWLLSGTHVFYAAHWDHARRSVVAATAQIKVISPKALIFRRAEVQELSVMLSWTDVLASQPIKRFLYRVGGASDTWATATEFGGAGGDQRSDVLRFSTPGLKRIFVAAEDVGGNLGTPNSVDVTTTLPPGFLLTDQFTSVFAGTKTNAQINSDGALLMMAPAETWNTHFSTRGYANTAAQVTAGFPLYFQPGTLSAQYVEEFDLARVVVSSTISFTGQYAWLNGGGTVTPKVSYRLTAVSAWIDVPNAWAAVGTNFRYFRITIDVAGTSQDDLLQVTALQATISTSQLLEYATVTSNAGDAAGTAYVTTKGFIDVTAAVFSPNSDTVARHSVIPDDSVSPAVVRVKCWDAAGTRITASGSLVIAGVGG